MAVAIVVNINDNSLEIGYGGDSRNVYTINQSLGWLDDDTTTFLMCKSWFHDILLTNTKDAKIVVSEPTWLSTARKQRLCKVLFGRIKVSSLCFVPNCLMAFIAGGISNGVYVEVFEKRTEVVPIFDGRILDNYSKSSVLGSDHEDFWIVDTDIDTEDFEKPLVPLIWSVLRLLPVDIRASVSNHILVVGPSTVNAHVSNYFKTVTTLGCWAGASLYTWNSLMKGLPDELEITSSEFEAHGNVPDWHTNRFSR